MAEVAKTTVETKGEQNQKKNPPVMNPLLTMLKLLTSYMQCTIVKGVINRFDLLEYS